MEEFSEFKMFVLREPLTRKYEDNTYIDINAWEGFSNFLEFFEEIH